MVEPKGIEPQLHHSDDALSQLSCGPGEQNVVTARGSLSRSPEASTCGFKFIRCPAGRGNSRGNIDGHHLGFLFNHHPQSDPTLYLGCHYWGHYELAGVLQCHQHPKSTCGYDLADYRPIDGASVALYPALYSSLWRIGLLPNPPHSWSDVPGQDPVPAFSSLRKHVIWDVRCRPANR